MLIRQVIEVFDVLDSPRASGEDVKKYLNSKGDVEVSVNKIGENSKTTDFIKIKIYGEQGKSCGGSAKTLGIIGRLGGLGARPELTGFVSDGDGALCVLSAASKFVEMASLGDKLPGDIIISTHICPDAPTIEHKPVPFMNSPVDMETMNRMEVDPEMDAILTVDTTKGNNVINCNGFALSPTVKEGYILPYSHDLISIMERTTGKLPQTFGLSTQDITPYANHLYHINSILQPATATTAPVVGVAITRESMVAGCATGATHFVDVEETARFIVEVAKDFHAGRCQFYDEEGFAKLITLYGEQKKFQTCGKSLSRKIKIGALTIGQSPRVDITEDVKGLFSETTEIVELGVLDDLTSDQISELKPEGEDTVLVSRLRDGRAVTLSEQKILPLIQRKVDELNALQISSIILMCTGEFPTNIRSKAPLIFPSLIIKNVVNALVNVRALTIVVPDEEQIESLTRKWSSPSRELHIVVWNPYTHEGKDLALRQIAAAAPDLVIFDCFGYSREMQNELKKYVECPSVLSRTLSFNILNEIE